MFIKTPTATSAQNICLLTLVFSTFSSNCISGAIYTELGGLSNTYTLTDADHLSNNGKYITGTSYTTSDGPAIFRWSLSEGMIQIDTPGVFPRVKGISDDGKALTGYYSPSLSSNSRVYYWSENESSIDIGDLGGRFIEVEAISGNGEVVIGYAEKADETIRAYYWNKTEGITELEQLDGSNNSIATGVSDDGKTIIGASGHLTIDTPTVKVFHWTESDGIKAIFTAMNTSDPDAINIIKGTPVVKLYDIANLSGDGSTVAGNYIPLDSNYYRAYHWTDASGFKDMGTLGGNFASAVLLNHDGSVIAGYSEADPGSFEAKIFRWTESEGMADTGIYGYKLIDMSKEGHVILALGVTKAEPLNAYRWDIKSGAQTIEQWLETNGVELNYEDFYYRMTSIIGMSDDGSTIAGNFQNLGTGVTSGFYARVSEQGNGFIVASDLATSLSATDQAINSSHQITSTLMNGALSNPMDSRISEGESSYKFFGDWGQDDHNNRDGEFGLYGLTLSKNFNATQINLSFGKAWSEHNIQPAGNIDNKGEFISLEGIVPLLDKYKTYATLTGYKYWGSQDINRGYLNAGNLDFSHASPDIEMIGWRARLDMLDIWQVNQMSISAYVDLSHTRGKLDAYTETGGGFPAAFAENTSKIEELRLGLRGHMPLPMPETQLMLNLEAAHRLDAHSEGIQGEVIGISEFTLDNQEYDRNWIKAGAGMSGRLFDGDYQFTLFATTQGEAPSLWLAASFQHRF